MHAWLATVIGRMMDGNRIVLLVLYSWGRESCSTQNARAEYCKGKLLLHLCTFSCIVRLLKYNMSALCTRGPIYWTQSIMLHISTCLFVHTEWLRYFVCVWFSIGSLTVCFEWVSYLCRLILALFPPTIYDVVTFHACAASKYTQLCTASHSDVHTVMYTQ